MCADPVPQSTSPLSTSGFCFIGVRLKTALITSFIDFWRSKDGPLRGSESPIGLHIRCQGDSLISL